ncbi:MAG TPA: exodeoxyribonuclease V subunit alpha [Mycobacterium sp.]|nr:exodeoxyribonuclease V subunit alpha [Mycobacterium sp.]
MMSLISVRPELRAYHEAGVLSVADVHTCVRVGHLGGETDERVLLAAALTVRALRHGSVCLELVRLPEFFAEATADASLEGHAAARALPWPDPDDLIRAVRASPLVTGIAAGGLRPLRLVDTPAGELLYLDRYYRDEQSVRTILTERESSRPAVDPGAVAAILDELFTHDGHPAAPPDRQRIAAALAVTEWTTILTGGPGTGKTHTVARTLALLHRTHGPGLRVALCAPTGKAAATLTDAVAAQAAALGLPAVPVASTLHRLLGARRGSSSRYVFNARNRLPYDIVVVDESSMVPLTLMARLLEALRPHTRLLLVGDPDQLTSVEAGAVLADLVSRQHSRAGDSVLPPIVPADLGAGTDGEEPPLDEQERADLERGVVRLQRGRRFDNAIARLAAAVRTGDVETTLAALAEGGDVTLLAPTDIAEVHAAVVAAGTELVGAAMAGDTSAALAALLRHRLLCAHREGPFGRNLWALRACDWIATALGRRLDGGGFYPGQPLLVTANDYDLGVFNGEIGVVMARGQDLVAVIEQGAAPLLIDPWALAEVQTAYAMTIHRSQGSQYDSVSIVLPDAQSPLLSRQLLYTAITRARRQVQVIASPEAVAAAVSRQARRASGLAV